MEKSPEAHIQTVDKHPETIYVSHRDKESFTPHAHSKGQLTYYEGGAAIVSTSHRAYFIPRRHYIWIPAGTVCNFEHRSQVTKSRTVYMNVEQNITNDFYNRIGIYPVNNLLLEMLLYSERWKGNIFPGTEAYQFMRSLFGVLPEVSKHPLPIELPVSDNERLVPVLKYIEGNYASNLTLEDVALHFGFSGRTLNRLFNTSIQITFFQYLKMTRMIKAMELLLMTDKNISEISYSVGYTSISSFSNAFFELAGKRPTFFMK